MSRLFLIVCSLFVVCSLLSSFSWANAPVTDNLSFSLHKIGDGEGPTILVIGGIQGDEPGGFHAASLLATRYNISNGSLWIVPNLNFPAIIKRSRGPNGDLNRKFAAIKADDPERDLVKRIKEIILDPNVDMVLNLHDGSGFYRKTYIDKKYNPYRWGQSVIIDQEVLEGVENGNLLELADNVVQDANAAINDEKKAYRVKNTKTKDGNVEMSKSLTYFVINNGKPAFGVEASKSLNKAERVSSHLHVLEAFMDRLNITHERNFDLGYASMKKVLKENRGVTFYDNRIAMEMNNARKSINYFPLDKDQNINFTTDDPLVTVVPLKKNNHFAVYHGNQKITNLSPQYFSYDSNNLYSEIKVDGQLRKVVMGSTINVKESFEVLPQEGYRVNVIGFACAKKDEAGQSVRKNKVIKRYSVDNSGQVFRLEFYRLGENGEKDFFSGMILVDFNPNSLQTIAFDDGYKKFKEGSKSSVKNESLQSTSVN